MSASVPRPSVPTAETFPAPPNPDEEADSLLAARNRILDDEVRTALAAKREAVLAHELPTSDAYAAIRTRAGIESVIAGAGYDPGRTTVVRPSQNNAATRGYDLAFNVMGLAQPGAGDRKAQIATITDTLASTLGLDDSIVRADVSGAFVNLQLDYRRIAPVVLAEVAALGDQYGHYRDGSPQTVIVDYSSPNVAKNMTVAHLRSTIIGDALCRLQTATGNVAFGINHIGDWGTQFGNIIYQYQQELAEHGQAFLDELNANPTATLMRIYRKFNEQKEAIPESAAAGRELFRRLEAGEPELVELWQQFRAWSLRDFAPAYERLGVTFDAIQGESFYEDRMAGVIADAVGQGVLVVDEIGATVFPSQPLVDPTTGKVNEKLMLDQQGEPRAELIVKPNGGTVYLTRDLAAIAYRAHELGADKILYVIGKEQGPHCMILFNVASQLGHMALGNALHISFGHLNVDGRKMKSRAGRVVLLNDILDESTAAAADMLRDRKAERLGVPVEDVELDTAELQTAVMIGKGAIIFNDLRQDRVKDIEFQPDMATNLEAGGSTYIQYTHARINSILERAGELEPLTQMPETLSTEEAQLVAQVADLPIAIQEAASMNAPHRLATYLTTLCQAVSALYQAQPILRAESATERTFRLHLVRAAKQALSNAAYLLNLDLPPRM